MSDLILILPQVLAGWWRDSNVEVDLGADVAADLQDDTVEVENTTSEFARFLSSKYIFIYIYVCNL